MSDGLSKLQRDFMAYHPAELMRAVIEIITLQYQVSWTSEVGCGLVGRRLHALVGLKRWALIEQEVAQLAARFNGVVPMPDAGGNEHVEIRSSRYLTTISCVGREGGFARESSFRIDHADTYQLRLGFAGTAEPLGIEYNAIIAHWPKVTPHGVDRSQVGGIVLGFPKADFSGWAFPPFDLVKMYTDAGRPAIVPERRRDDAKPKLRSGGRGGSDTTGSQDPS